MIHSCCLCKTGYSGTGVVGWFFKNINPLIPMGFCAMWMHWLLKSRFWILKKNNLKLSLRRHVTYSEPTIVEVTAQAQSTWFSSVQSLNGIQLFATPWTEACQASLSISNSQSLLKLMSIESVIPSPPLSTWCKSFLLIRLAIMSNKNHEVTLLDSVWFSVVLSCFFYHQYLKSFWINISDSNPSWKTVILTQLFVSTTIWLFCQSIIGYWSVYILRNLMSVTHSHAISYGQVVS